MSLSLVSYELSLTRECLQIFDALSVKSAAYICLGAQLHDTAPILLKQIPGTDIVIGVFKVEEQADIYLFDIGLDTFNNTLENYSIIQATVYTNPISDNQTRVILTIFSPDPNDTILHVNQLTFYTDT